MLTRLDRRTLLAGSLALGASGLALPRIALAQGSGARNLLFVLLRGAADGMAMLAPSAIPGLRHYAVTVLPITITRRVSAASSRSTPPSPKPARPRRPERRCSSMQPPPPIANARISTGRTCWRQAAPRPMRPETAGSTG
jgi:hypothetical protein